MTWKETAQQLRCSQVSTPSKEAFFKIMVFGLSMILLQSRMCFKCSVPDCHCQSTSWGTRSLPQRLSQIIASGKFPTSEHKPSDFKPKKIWFYGGNNQWEQPKNSEQLQENCGLNTAHSCFISLMGRFAANCLQIVHLLISELCVLQISAMNAPESTLLATGEAFSQDWKFPSCRKTFFS